MDIFQPITFVRWSAVEWALRRRAALAGLRVEAVALEWPARRVAGGGFQVRVRVEVRRSADRRWKWSRRRVVNKAMGLNEGRERVGDVDCKLKIEN